MPSESTLRSSTRGPRENWLTVSSRRATAWRNSRNGPQCAGKQHPPVGDRLPLHHPLSGRRRRGGVSTHSSQRPPADQSLTLRLKLVGKALAAEGRVWCVGLCRHQGLHRRIVRGSVDVVKLKTLNPMPTRQ
jgi:hypothetical protein